MSLAPWKVVRLGWCIVLACACAAAAAPSSSPWTVRVWPCRGVTERVIVGVAQAGDGFLWFAAPRQLVRFDGARMETYATTDVAPIDNQRNRALLAARDGAVWLATDGGQLVRFGPEGVTNFSGRLPHATPDSLVDAVDGSVWISFEGAEHAICRIQHGEVTRFSGPESAGRCVLATDAQGNVWYAAGAELGVLQEGRFKKLPTRILASARLTGARDGGIWLAAANGIYRVTADGTVRRVDSPDAPFTSYPNVLLEDRRGGLWIGTSPDGLFHFSPGGELERIATSYPEIISLTEDREGNIWAGTAGTGVNCVSPRAISVEGGSTGLPQHAIQSVCEDTDQVVWGCTQSGTLLRRTPAGTWQTEASWPAGVTVVTADPRGGIWIGTRKSALYRLRRGIVDTWTGERGLRAHTVSGIVVAPDGNVWLSLEGPNAIGSLGPDDALRELVPSPAGRVESMVADEAGRVWFGFGKGRLFRTDGHQLVDATPEGGPVAPIRALDALPHGTLWLGYRGGGLGRLSGGHFTHYGAEDGLYSNSVVHLVSDRAGWLWCAGEDGIFKVRLKDLDAYAGRDVKLVPAVHYGPEAGLPNLPVTAKTWGRAVRMHDGRIWIPMATALVIADPARAPDDPTAPPVLITAVRADGRRVAVHRGMIAERNPPVALPAEGGLPLPAVRQRLEFDFTALSFTAPENVQFRYRLDSFDDDWVAAGAARSAAYTHVPPGDYTFRLQACNSAGVWSEAGATVAVTIAPRFWQRWWFRFLVIAAFTGATALLVRRISHRRLQRKLLVLQQQMAVERERSRIARDLHDDAGNRLTRISLLTNLALRDRAQPTQAAAHLEQLAVAAREATDAFDEVVWAVNPRNDNLPEFVSYLAHFARQFADAAGIPCLLDVPIHLPERELPTDVRHNLFLAAKEAINNAIRHAGATQLQLTIAATDRLLTIVVADNGRGIPAAAVAPGADGLRNFQQRMDEIGGTVRIDTSPQAGTTLTFTYPWAAQEARPVTPDPNT